MKHSNLTTRYLLCTPTANGRIGLAPPNDVRACFSVRDLVIDASLRTISHHQTMLQRAFEEVGKRYAGNDCVGFSVFEDDLVFEDIEKVDGVVVCIAKSMKEEDKDAVVTSNGL